MLYLDQEIVFMYYEKSKQLIEQQRNQFQFVCLDDLVPNDHI